MIASIVIYSLKPDFIVFFIYMSDIGPVSREFSMKDLISCRLIDAYNDIRYLNLQVCFSVFAISFILSVNFLVEVKIYSECFKRISKKLT